MTWLVKGEKRVKRLERRQGKGGKRSVPCLGEMCITIRDLVLCPAEFGSGLIAIIINLSINC